MYRAAAVALWPVYVALTLASHALHWIIWREWAPLCARAAWVDRGLWRAWCRAFDALLFVQEPDHCVACLRRHLRKGLQ